MPSIIGIIFLGQWWLGFWKDTKQLNNGGSFGVACLADGHVTDELLLPEIGQE